MAHACSIETGMRRRSKERGVPPFINSAKPSLRECHMKLGIELPLAEPGEHESDHLRKQQTRIFEVGYVGRPQW